MPNDNTIEKLREMLQQYSAQADAWRRERTKAEENVQTYEALSKYCERLIKAQELAAEGRDIKLEVLEAPRELGQSVWGISVPRAVDNVLRSNRHPMHTSEVSKRVRELYPNIVVNNLERQVNNSLGRGVLTGKYEMVAQGVYKVISED